MATSETNLDVLNEQHNNYCGAHDKIVLEIKGALSTVFALSTWVAFQQSLQNPQASQSNPKMYAYVLVIMLIWSVGELWVLARKSRIGASVLVVTAIMMLGIYLEDQKDDHVKNFPILQGVLVLLSLYVFRLTSKFQKLKRAESSWWKYHFPKGSIYEPKTLEELRTTLHSLQPEQIVEVLHRTFSPGEPDEVARASADALAEGCGCGVRHSGLGARKTAVFTKLGAPTAFTSTPARESSHAPPSPR